ncbi:hypothetical protein MLD38_004033 [Melastoma candidum]|uniref:Uncharacterized protein n=1 Tax=Melastoma candidum TaxID=119954 RepID=A0ACB9S6D1_9MYRT|nr:hypothetical protein MLD38_004033 [Melastoma candidum]
MALLPPPLLTILQQLRRGHGHPPPTKNNAQCGVTGSTSNRSTTVETGGQHQHSGAVEPSIPQVKYGSKFPHFHGHAQTHSHGPQDSTLPKPQGMKSARSCSCEDT